MTYRTEIHLHHLVEKYQAKSATWEYVEDTKHVTRGVMHWVVTLYDAKLPIYERGWIRRTHVMSLATGCHLNTDEYVTRLVIQKLEGTQ